MIQYSSMLSYKDDYCCENPQDFNFPIGLPAPFDIHIIKLFSFEAYGVIILADFSLLQLFISLTLSEPHLSITLHVIRKVLHHLFHLGKILHLLQDVHSFLLQSNTMCSNCVVRCLRGSQQITMEAEKCIKWHVLR